ncbi:MAG: hypothetical protein JSU63_12780 [Phycisphaerales bacterium]|nr:MAG: hypothetical protein JSU63_12780 [Phycisphaerales bacterium]
MTRCHTVAAHVRRLAVGAMTLSVSATTMQAAVAQQDDCPSRGGKGASQISPSPQSELQPSLFCAASTVESQPVWRGKPVKCVFDIRNNGQADLRIEARAG